MTRPNSVLIEPRFKESLDNYIEHGWQPGGFLTAVLSNDLSEAIARADESATDNLPHIVAYVYNELPGNCWGSREKVREWLLAERTS